MIFLHPALLLGLPAVLVPLFVHLLNRLRYRSVKWAAIMFLIMATRSSTRRARLRHYLIMACRMLIVLSILLALSRPLIGGWLGATFGGTPELVIILLDRSASMETAIPEQRLSKREHAVNLLTQGSRFSGPATHFVLIESALRAPVELAGLTALKEMAFTKPTDTAADLPAMFRAALDYILKQRPASLEIWVVSDLQESNWRPESSEWQSLNAQLAALPQSLRVLVLDLSGAEGANRSVALRSLLLRQAPPAEGGTPAARGINFTVDLRANQPSTESFPMIVTINGVRSQVPITMSAQDYRYHGKGEIPGAERGAGWGKIEIPADDNPRDNVCYFVYAEEQPRRAAVLVEDAFASRVFQAALAPDPQRLGSSCAVLDQKELARVVWNELDLLVWQAPPPEPAVENTLRSFVADGGTVLCFPPARADATGLFGIAWGAIDTAESEKPFRISVWNEQDGILARTDSGDSLPLAQLAVHRRQAAAPPPPPAENQAAPEQPPPAPWIKLATFADRKPFLQSWRIGDGQVFIWSTLPRKDWSTLVEGTVLVPALQRALQLGGARRQVARLAECGAWHQAADQKNWQALAPSSNSDYRCQAGVYQSENQSVALNCPAAELLRGALEAKTVRQLLGDLRLEIFTDTLNQTQDQMLQEIWRILVCLALAALALETFLVSTPRLFMDKAALAVNGTQT